MNHVLLVFAIMAPTMLAKAALIGEPTVVARGRDSRVWQTVQEVDIGGKIVRKTNSYTELQTALFRFDRNLNDLVETDRRIELFQDGAIIRNLVYNVIFAPNLASQGAIDILLPDGASRLTGQIMGLAFTEGSTSVLLAESRDCSGEVIGPDQNILVYRSAFTDFDIDVQFQAERANFSQTIIFKERIPDPTQYGLSLDAHLELLTEWTTAPPIEKETYVWEPAHDNQHALTDENMSVAGGAMKFLMGKGFHLGEAEQSFIPIAKSWEVIQGRSFTVEKIPWRRIAAEFLKLPPRQARVAPNKDKDGLLAKNAKSADSAASRLPLRAWGQ